MPGLHLSGPQILGVFLPGLLFQGSITLDRSEVRRHLLPIGLLATFGVALTVLTIGALGHLVLGLPWPAAMLLGAILSATDPVAVVSLLRRLRAPGGVAALLEGESLFNDATGVAAFSAIAGSVIGGRPAAADIAVRFLVLVGAGAGIGLVAGAAGRLLLRLIRAPGPQLALTVVVAYLTYAAADRAGGSGVAAVVVTGIVMATASERLIHLWDPIATVLNSALFLILGLQFPGAQVLGLGWLVPALFGVMVASRLLPVYGLLAVSDPLGRWIPWSWRHLTFWSGLRGGLSVALALSLGDQGAVYPRVAPAAYGVIAMSLLVQGGLLWPVARLLKLSGSGPPPPPGGPPPPAPR